MTDDTTQQNPATPEAQDAPARPDEAADTPAVAEAEIAAESATEPSPEPFGEEPVVIERDPDVTPSVTVPATQPHSDVAGYADAPDTAVTTCDLAVTTPQWDYHPGSGWWYYCEPNEVPAVVETTPAPAVTERPANLYTPPAPEETQVNEQPVIHPESPAAEQPVIHGESQPMTELAETGLASDLTGLGVGIALMLAGFILMWKVRRHAAR